VADELLVVCGGQPVGKCWAKIFVTCSGKLKVTSNQSKDRQRLLQEDPVVIRTWVELVEDTRAKYGVHNNDVHNFDKTGFQMGIIGTMKVIIGSERHIPPELFHLGDCK
jgi:hypothetical protein